MESTTARTSPRHDDVRAPEAKRQAAAQDTRAAGKEAVQAAALAEDANVAQQANLADVAWASGERSETDDEIVIKTKDEEEQEAKGEPETELATSTPIELASLAGTADFATLVAEAGQFATGSGEGLVTAELGEVEGTYTLFGDDDDGGSLLLIGLGLVVLVGGAILLLDDSNKNDPPSITSAATASIAENSAISTVVLDVNATDPDKNDEVTFSLTGTDAAAFTIDADDGEIRFKASPDFETKASYTFTVVATDEDGDTAQQNVTITVTNVNEAPVIGGTTPVSINENVAAGSTAFTPTGTDPENGAITYSLTGTDATAFNINPTTGVVTFVASPNFETKSSYTFNVVGTDPAGNAGTRAVTVNIADVNEAPTVTQASPVSINENVAAGTVVFTPTGTDPENGAITYSLTGTDAAAFNINSTTGAVSIVASPDFETKSSYNINVVGTDPGGLTSARSVVVNVNNLPDTTQSQFNAQLGHLAAEVTGETAFEDADQFFYAPLTAMNGSSVNGVVLAAFDDDTNELVVTVQGDGLESGQVITQGIYGFAPVGGTTANATLPTIANDTDGDGFIELGEGSTAFGTSLLSLMSGGAFPTAAADGSFSFTQTYQLPAQGLGSDPLLALRQLVVSGQTLAAGEGSGSGEADGTAGFKANLPVAAADLDLLEPAEALNVVQFLNSFVDSTDFSSQFGFMLSSLTGEAAFEQAEQFYYAPLTALNNSSVSGVALAALDEDTGELTVTTQMRGLQSNEIHTQGIFGFAAMGGTTAPSVRPTLANDLDGDGFIEASEAASAFGQFLLPLTGGGEYPTASADGTVSFTQTYQLPSAGLGVDPQLALRQIAVNGLTLSAGQGSGTGEADGTAGFKTGLPAAAGTFAELTSLNSLAAQTIFEAFAHANPIA